MPALDALPAKLKPMIGEQSAHIGILRDDGRAAIGKGRGVGQRGARRRLHDHHEIALIFLGNKAGGNVTVDPDGCAQPGEEEHQQHVAQLQRHVNDARIGAGQSR